MIGIIKCVQLIDINKLSDDQDQWMILFCCALLPSPQELAVVKKVVQDDANTAESLGLVQVTLLEGKFRHNRSGSSTMLIMTIILIIVMFFNVKSAKGQ